MTTTLTRLSLLLFLLCNAYFLAGQSLNGFVLDEENNPVPFANVFIPAQDIATNSDGEGRYSISCNPGNFDVLVSCVGYEDKRLNVDIGDGITEKNIYLKFSDLELEEAVVKANGKDPAFAIIKHVVDNRKKFLRQFSSYKTHIYIKASEEKIIKEKPKKSNAEEEQFEDSDTDELEMEKGDTPTLPSVSFLEMDVDFSFEFPNKSKEVRTAYQAYGDKSGFLVPNLNEVNFNFYENLVSLRGISDVPVISPIANASILSYKYKLINTAYENGIKVYEIEIIPRKKGNATVKGTIWINDGIWNINRIQIELPKDALKFYDDLSLVQHYDLVSDSTWVCSLQEFNYISKANKYKIFEGKTRLEYSQHELDIVFPEKYFSNEVGVTTEEAYERDSTYWSSLRPAPLTEKEQVLVHKTDSINAYHKSPEYLDSLQAVRNKINLGKIFLHGVDFWNYEKKQELSISPVASMLDYSFVDGIRVGPGFRYTRRYEKTQRFFMGSAYGSASINTGNIIASGNMRWLTNPKKRAWTRMNFYRGFVSVNPFGAYLSQLNLVNYIKTEQFYLSHSRELVNGFYISGYARWRNRNPLGDAVDPSELIEDYITRDGILDNFSEHQALTTSVGFSFTPHQKYMTEPKRKVILGSKWPTFSFDYTKAWNGLFSSDIAFDQIEFGVDQKVTLGTFGYSKYTINTGTYLTTDSLYQMDQKWIRQSDPILYSEPLNTFQLLDTTFTTTKFYIEGHFIHHFNGALINNIPAVKLLKLRAVAGASAMYIAESNYRHEEFLLGAERVFKLGARRRLKLGVYGIIANSNKTPTTAGFKLAIDILDTWQRDWSF